ncbi:MAG: hypothetical protein EXS55_00535 [Candidatus Magasanikbacteria bacterium]|nr:hypothetical protein [Candidatus Magasanikbacteria bacterium]
MTLPKRNGLETVIINKIVAEALTWVDSGYTLQFSVGKALEKFYGKRGEPNYVEKRNNAYFKVAIQQLRTELAEREELRELNKRAQENERTSAMRARRDDLLGENDTYPGVDTIGEKEEPLLYPDAHPRHQ